MSMRLNDLTGKRFGRLIVISREETKKSPGGAKRTMWRCKCDCGKETIVWAYSLTSGRTESCGCLHKEVFLEKAQKATITHGGTKERLYSVWRDMINRCKNENERLYKDYGGRGITICDEWMDYAAFRDWAIKAGYDESAKRGSCTIDRIDVNGNYEPSNCRWANQKIQQNNKRNNRFITYNGVTKTMTEWAEEVGIGDTTLANRLDRGWPIELALYKPVRPWPGKRIKV